MNRPDKLGDVGQIIPLLRRLAVPGDGQVRVVAVEDRERQALADLILFLETVEFTCARDSTSGSSPDDTTVEKSMFDQYLATFNTPLKKEARGTAMGKSRQTEGFDKWLSCLQAVKVLRIAQTWRKKAAESSRLRQEQNMVQVQLADELALIHSWDKFDCFAVAKASNGHPLEVTAMALLQRLDIPKKLQLPLVKLRKFLSEIEQAYAKGVPYHSATHASDVVQGVASFLCTEEELSSSFTDLEVLSLILSATIHDCGHPGVNNAFLITTRSDMAYCYNDISVNENMHLSLAFKILSEPENNFLSNLTEADFRFVRRLVIDTVISTDMAFHTGLLKNFGATVGLLGPNVSTWEGEARTLLFKYILHAVDISNPGRPWAKCRKWAERITHENFSQGDRENEVGVPVSPLNDRSKANVVKGQQVFCDLFVKPTFVGLAPIAPTICETVLQHCTSNSNRYQGLLDEGMSQLPDA